MTARASHLPGAACEVLIVGAGPTGLLLAVLLAGRGVDVQLLERRTERSTHSRAIGLHPPAVAALGQAGLAEVAVAAGEPIRVGRARSRGRDLGALHFARAWPNRPFVLSLPQSRTEELLEQRLAELAPGVLHRDWEVTALQQQATGAEVTARGPDGEVRWRAQVVVGADGTRSRVRELLGVGTTFRSHPDTYVMGDFSDPTGSVPGGAGPARPGRARPGREHARPGREHARPGRSREAVIHLEPGGVVESFPLPGGNRRWVAHTGAAPASGSADDLAAIVADRTGERLEVDSNSMISAFSVRSRLARRTVVGRTVLIGDAAHEISPIGGQGITLGWLDVLAVAPLLEDTARAHTGSSLREQRAFIEFERDRGRAARLAAKMAQLNMVLGRAAPLPVVRARDLLLRLLLGTPARHAMAWVYSMGWARRRAAGPRVR